MTTNSLHWIRYLKATDDTLTHVPLPDCEPTFQRVQIRSVDIGQFLHVENAPYRSLAGLN